MSIPVLGAISIFGLKELYVSNNLNLSIISFISVSFSFIISLLTIKFFLYYIKKFNLLNSSLDKVLCDFENKNFNFLGSLIIDTWNNSKSVELMLDDIICSDEA